MSEIGGENGGERCHWRSRKVVAEPGVVRAVRGGNDALRVRLGFRGLRDFSPPTIEEVRGSGGGGRPMVGGGAAGASPRSQVADGRRVGLEEVEL
jgi:hypothetical protein